MSSTPNSPVTPSTTPSGTAPVSLPSTGPYGYPNSTIPYYHGIARGNYLRSTLIEYPFIKKSEPGKRVQFLTDDGTRNAMSIAARFHYTSLHQVDRFRHIPASVVQGRFDVVTPMWGAWALHTAWPEAQFEVVWDAGHASTEPGVIDALVRATDAAADLPRRR